jgi:nucleoside-diphosphate-sugar epimerase/predicted dehydrogenase
MNNNIIKVGLLGAGFIVDSHAKAIKALPNVEIVAVCDRATDRAEETAKSYAIPNVFSELTEMLKLDLDVVHVLLPPDLHISTTKEILESGVSAFLEKPMGLDSVECQSLVDLAKKKGLKLGVNHNFLFLPAYEKLRQQAKDGTLGNLDHVTINWLYALGLIQFGPFNNWMLREPQNLWFELGPHLTAFMMDLIGPLDSLTTHVSREIDLPGGSRVYRKWHVHGIKGNSTVDLNMSVVPGYVDRSITVRGHAATAKCDFDRDVFYRDEPSGHGMLFDSFITNLSIAKQLAKNSFSNLISSVKHTLKKSPEANPFGVSIARSIKSFYETLDGELDNRVDGQFGVDVIKACEKITQKAKFTKPKSNKKWTVLPPIKTPTVLVIGGTGFIGRYLVRQLTDAGHGVRVITRGASAGNIGLAGLPVELVQGDIASEEFMLSALDGIEVVYDLAKATGSKWEDYYQNDVLVTKNIAECAQKAGVKQFIYTGTIDSYYSANANEVINADTPLDKNMKNRNLYAKSKATCEALLLQMHKDSGFPVSIFRPGVVIGTGCPPAHWGVGMFQSESRVQFWGSGENKLPLVLVDDVASALVLALGRTDIAGETFLLTDAPMLSGKEYVDIVSNTLGTKLRAEPTSIFKFFIIDAFKEAAKNIIKHPNRKIPSYRDWDSRSHRATYDNSKTKQTLGWKPVENREVLIEKGIVQAVNVFMK